MCRLTKIKSKKKDKKSFGAKSQLYQSCRQLTTQINLVCATHDPTIFKQARTNHFILSHAQGSAAWNLLARTVERFLLFCCQWLAASGSTVVVSKSCSCDKHALQATLAVIQPTLNQKKVLYKALTLSVIMFQFLCWPAICYSALQPVACCCSQCYWLMFSFLFFCCILICTTQLEWGRTKVAGSW